jgi:hypothetical protein
MSEENEQQPDRHADFYLLSDSILTMDGMIKNLETPERMNEFVNQYVDGESLAIVAEGRVFGIATVLPFPHNIMLSQIREIVFGIWQDGFITAQLFAERKNNGLMVVPDTLEGIDGL